MVLIVRRMAEWIGEIALARHERLEQHRHAFHTLFAESTFLVLAVVFSIGFSTDLAFSTLPWALAPLVAVRGARLSFSGGSLNLHTLLPHLGSTAIIGASVYVFRLSISLLAGKTLAGILLRRLHWADWFRRYSGRRWRRHWCANMGQPNNCRRCSLQCRLRCSQRAPVSSRGHDEPGLGPGDPVASPSCWQQDCPFAGAVMSLAALLRTRLIHGDDGREVFGPDLLANVLLTSCVPFAYHAFGQAAFSGLYLFGACLSLFSCGGGPPARSGERIPWRDAVRDRGC